MESINQTTRLLRDLVRIPSVNPAGDPGTRETGEKKLAEFIAARLRKAGARVIFQSVERGRPNLLARFPVKRTPTMRILLAPHLDTVSVANMTIPPFRGFTTKGRLYGRGASDTKGPMAAMLTALFEVTRREAYQDGTTEFSFAGFMGEESGCEGARYFTAKSQRPRYDFAIIGEPTDGRIVYAHKGCSWTLIIIPGKGGHASLADYKVNAILRAGRVLKRIEQEFIPWLEQFRHPVLGPPTAVPTILRGGSKGNIAPDQVTCTLDIRTTPSLPVSTMKNKLLQLLDDSDTGAFCQFPVAGDPLDTDPRHPLVQQILPACRGLTVAPWFCDAAALARGGIPAIALGPGSIKQAHTADEWISLKSLQDGHRRYVKVLERLMGQDMLS